MNQSSDSESRDSDEGIRFKTCSVRRKEDENLSSSRSRSSDEDCFGPKLPHHLPKKKDDSRSEESRKVLGPQLPPHLQKKEAPTEIQDQSSYIGPQLPPHLRQKSTEVEDLKCGGPQLPLQKSSEAGRIGPELPPHLRRKSSEADQSSYIGPHLPPHFQKTADEDSEDEIYGPLPAGASMSKTQLALEERALLLKMDQLEPDKNKPPSREEWMLELPEVKAAKFGLGPRQFRAKQGPDMSDRSSWTDTPDKKRKKKEKAVDLRKETELKEIRKRDEQQEKISKKLKKKNKESLLEIHQSKMKDKKKEEPTERRPFSRETDLQVNRFDEAQKKAVLKKAQLLDDRFSSGQSKFL